MNKKILCVCYGGGHVTMIVPIVKRLAEFYDIHVLGLTTARATLEKENIPCFSFRDLPLNDKAANYGEMLVTDMVEHPLIPKEESIAYMGLSYQSLVEDHGEKQAKELYKKHGRAAFLPVNLMEHIIQEGNYDLVIATNSPRTERAAIIAAGKLGIPSLCINDLFATEEISWVGQSGYANKICVLSEFVRERLINVGRPKDEIVVTGNPAFDSLAELRNSNVRSVIRNNKGWQDSETVILWASNVERAIDPYSKREGDPSLPSRVEKELTNIVENNRDFRVIFRPHPSDTRRPITAHEKVELSSYADNINELLTAVDCVIILVSTVGLQAALIGKPVLSINLSVFPHAIPYDEMGISIGVDNLKDLYPSILEALEKGQQGKGLPVCGQATAMIADQIEILLENKN